MLEPIFELKVQKEEKNYGRFIFEPLPYGFGHTLGNALRRILLAWLSGAAISRVKIKGVRHQFLSIPGLKEDVVELILNLRKVNFRLEGEKEALLNLKKRGPGKITAADIKTPAEVTVVNKEQYLGSLADKKSSLEIKIWLEKGKGYLPSEERKFSEVGVIPVDSFFNPVRRVNYQVEETRVGRATNFDKLILEVWTNGTLSPSKSLKKGAKILLSYFQHIYKPQKTTSKESSKKDLPERIFRTPFEELDIPIRIVNALKKGGLKTIGDAVGKKREDLEKIKNIGDKSIELVVLKLKEKGVSL